MAKNNKKIFHFIRQYSLIIFNSLILISVIGLGFWHYFASKAVTPQIAEINQAAGKVTLKLNPSTVTAKINTETTLTISINTTSAKVTAASIELDYDPKKLKYISTNKGDFLTNVLFEPRVDKGKIFFTYAAPPASGGKKGQGKLAVIKFKTRTYGQAKLLFTNNTQVATIDSDQNELKSATNATIKTPQASLDPTPSPSSNPTPTPTPNPSPSPITSPSPTPTPTSNLTPAPQSPPPPNPDPTPTPNTDPNPSPISKSSTLPNHIATILPDRPIDSSVPNLPSQPLSNPTTFGHLPSQPTTTISPQLSAPDQETAITLSQPTNIIQKINLIFKQLVVNIYNFFSPNNL